MDFEENIDDDEYLDKLSPRFHSENFKLNDGVIERVSDDYEFDQHFQCPLCIRIVKDPVECDKCENMFCSECTKSLDKRVGGCPFKCQNAKFKEIHRYVK